MPTLDKFTIKMVLPGSPLGFCLKSRAEEKCQGGLPFRQNIRANTKKTQVWCEKTRKIKKKTEIQSIVHV